MDDEIRFEKAVGAVRQSYDGKTVPFSTHMLCSDGCDWESIVRKDPYFDDVNLIGSVDEFVRLIRCDRYLLGTDVAKYILSKMACTHTKLEKLVYLCYADYLCETGKRLFTDRIFAFEYGPVVESVFGKYGDSTECVPVEIRPGSDRKHLRSKVEAVVSRSRLMFSEDGIEKAYSIDRTLEKYGHMTAVQLVRMTHIEHAPWTHIERYGFYDCIPDEIIEKYHCFEVPQ